MLAGVGVVLFKYFKKGREIAEQPVVEVNDVYGVKVEDYYEDRDTRDNKGVDLNEYYA